MRFHAVDGVEIPQGVEVPDNFAGRGFVGPDVSVPRSEKRYSGDHGNGRRLGGAASFQSQTGWFGRGRHPEFFTGGHLQSYEASAHFGLAEGEVGDADVGDSAIVSGASPHGSTVDSAGGDFQFPEKHAFM